MKNTIKRKISLLQSEKLIEFSEIIHFFSTRKGGISKGAFESLNFGTNHGETENMKLNLSILASSIDQKPEGFIIPQQTHGEIIGVVDNSNYNSIFENTDSLITNIPSIILAVKTADCVPILLFDPIKKAIGAVHSGWRGTTLNIVGKTIVEMSKVFGSNPSNIIASIGPCISQKNYEVGIDVVQKFEPKLFDHKTIFNYEKTSNGKAFLDLSEANLQLLINAGLHTNNIELSGSCTFEMKNEFFSARRDGYITGRMINAIGILSGV